MYTCVKISIEIHSSDRKVRKRSSHLPSNFNLIVSQLHAYFRFSRFTIIILLPLLQRADNGIYSSMHARIYKVENVRQHN